MSRFLTKNGKRIQTVSSVMLFGSFLLYIAGFPKISNYVGTHRFCPEVQQ